MGTLRRAYARAFQVSSGGQSRGQIKTRILDPRWKILRTSLVAQWLRICLAMWVRSLGWGTKTPYEPMPATTEPECNNYSPWTPSLPAATTIQHREINWKKKDGKIWRVQPPIFQMDKLSSQKAGEQRGWNQSPGLWISNQCFLLPLEFSPPSVNLGQIRPLVALLNSRNLPFLTYTQPCCLRKLVINFFFSGNALLPSLQNNVFIIAKPFPSLRRKCIPHDSPKLSCPGLQIQYVNSFVNIYSGWQLRETCGIN